MPIDGIAPKHFTSIVGPTLHMSGVSKATKSGPHFSSGNDDAYSSSSFPVNSGPIDGIKPHPFLAPAAATKTAPIVVDSSKKASSSSGMTYHRWVDDIGEPNKSPTAKRGTYLDIMA